MADAGLVAVIARELARLNDDMTIDLYGGDPRAAATHIAEAVEAYEELP